MRCSPNTRAKDIRQRFPINEYMGCLGLLLLGQAADNRELESSVGRERGEPTVTAPGASGAVRRRQ